MVNGARRGRPPAAARGRGRLAAPGRPLVEVNVMKATPLKIMEGGTSATPLERRYQIKNSTAAKRAGKEAVSVSESETDESMSIGMTEIAQMCTDSLVDEEVESSHGLVIVQGYRVKPEVAPLLQYLFTKYGDIARSSTLQSPSSRSLFLEMLCSIIQRLQRSTFRDLTSREVAAMLRDVQDLEEVRFDVGWLRRKLEELETMKHLVEQYPALKQQEANIEQKQTQLKLFELELANIQHMVNIRKQNLKILTDKYEQEKQKFVEMKDRIVDAYEKDLVDGLL